MDRRIKNFTKDNIEKRDSQVAMSMAVIRDKIKFHEKYISGLKDKWGVGAVKSRFIIKVCRQKIEALHKESFDLWKKYNGLDNQHDPAKEEDRDVRPNQSEVSGAF